MSDEGTMTVGAIIRDVYRRDALLVKHESKRLELYALRNRGQGETDQADSLRAEILALWVEAQPVDLAGHCMQSGTIA